MDREQIEDWEKERHDWVWAIGEYMLLCGDIEACTYDLLENLLSDDLPGHISNMSFMPRCNLIKELIPQRLDRFQHRHRLLKLISKMEDVAKKRNVIAHNPLDLKVVSEHMGFETRQVVRRYFASQSARENSEVTLPALQAALAEHQRNYSELNQLAYRVRDYLEKTS